MSRPTLQQLEALVEFLEQNPGIAKGLLRTAHAKQETKRKWDGISLALNALGGAQKDGKGWAKYWADKKCTLKKICAQHGQSMRRTGGGPADNSPALTPLDQRLIAVMGGLQFAAGDSHVAVSPFPSTSQSQNDDIPIVIQIIEDESNYYPPDIPASSLQSAETGRVETNSPPPPPAPTQSSHSRDGSRTSQRQRGLSRPMLSQDRDRFAAIERDRVEAETMTTRAFTDVAQNLATLNTNLANAVVAMREGSQAIADALNNIASALQNK